MEDDSTAVAMATPSSPDQPDLVLEDLEDGDFLPDGSPPASPTASPHSTASSNLSSPTHMPPTAEEEAAFLAAMAALEADEAGQANDEDALDEDAPDLHHSPSRSVLPDLPDLPPPADAGAFSFSSPAEMPPRDAMSDPAPASGGLA